MRIGIDARMYGPKQGGLGRYIEQLILHLELVPTNDEFVIFLRQDNWNDYQPSAPNFHKILANISWYGLTEQLYLPSTIKKAKVDLMHFPHWNVPLCYNAPFIVTIHDLLLLHHPTRQASKLGPFSYWFKNRAFKLVLGHAAKKAKHILTVSKFSKNDIAATMHIPPEKITVTYPAPSPTLASSHSSLFNLHSLGITKPYILYVGVAYPHKNLEGLLHAWKIFTEKYGDHHQLVLAGKIDYFYKRLRLTARRLKLHTVVFTDFVSDPILEQLYQQADAYIFPSLYEGFGLPPLEAMQHGIPVIASDRTCLPEILGDAAYFIDPTDPQAIAEACHTVLTDTSVRQQLRAAAAGVRKRYSWQRLAEQTDGVYKKVIEKLH